MGLAAAGIIALTGCTATVSPGYTGAYYEDPYYYGPYFDTGPDVFIWGDGPYYHDGHRQYWHRGIEGHHHFEGGHVGGFHGTVRGSGHGSGGYHGGGHGDHR